MDKIVFLAALAEKLSRYPISNEDVERHIQNMQRYFDTVSDEELAMENPSETDIETIAENLYQKYHFNAPKKQEENEEAEEAAAPAEEVVEEAVEPETQETADTAEEAVAEPAEEIAEEIADTDPSDADDYFEALAKEAEEERRDQEKLEELKRLAIERAIAENDEMVQNIDPEALGIEDPGTKADLNAVFNTPSEPEFDPIEDIVDPAERPDIAFSESEATRIFSTDDSMDIPAAGAYLENEDSGIVVDSGKLKAVDETKKKNRKTKEKVKGTPLFWTLFIVTLPITFPLAVGLSALFAVAYLLVTGVIVVLSAAMVATVAVGTVLALVGIVYGVTQVFKVGAIGMFEIGMGIAIGGITMLLSVLLYNTAIRFTPMLYKCLSRLAKLVYTKLEQLYYTLKKECGR